jgi:hypothetical protein
MSSPPGIGRTVHAACGTGCVLEVTPSDGCDSRRRSPFDDLIHMRMHARKRPASCSTAPGSDGAEAPRASIHKPYDATPRLLRYSILEYTSRAAPQHALVARCDHLAVCSALPVDQRRLDAAPCAASSRSWPRCSNARARIAICSSSRQRLTSEHLEASAAHGARRHPHLVSWNMHGYRPSLTPATDAESLHDARAGEEGSGIPVRFGVKRITSNVAHVMRQLHLGSLPSVKLRALRA